MTEAPQASAETERKLPVGRRPIFAKWLIFGVLLPLLPFAARALAAWVDDNSNSLSFNSLLSDGELLVVATVISAAVIGDLLFDFSGSNEGRSQSGKALLCAVALVAVIVSVLMFGLVTLNNQDRSNSFQQSETEVSEISNGNTLISRQEADLRAEYTEQSTTARHDAALALGAEKSAQSQIADGKTTGPLFTLLKQQIASYEAEATAAEQQASDENGQASSLSIEILNQQRTADLALVGSLRQLTIGEKQASDMSIILFIVSFLIGIFSFMLPKARSKEERMIEAPHSS